MDITPGDITAIVVGLASIITALGTAVAGILVAVGTNRKVEAQAAIMHAVSKATDKIEGHVNSKASTDAARIDALERQILTLTQTVQDQKQTAQSLATATANADLLRNNGKTIGAPDSPTVVEAPVLVVAPPRD